MPPAIGIIETAAGTGEKGYAGDGGLATHARMSEPFMCAFDAWGISMWRKRPTTAFAALIRPRG